MKFKLRVKSPAIYLLISISIVVIAAAYRLAGLDEVPPSLNWDEVSHGFNAYSIWKTGRDEWGFWFPSIFRAFGDFKLPAYIYATVPWVAIGGMNAWTVRLTSALAGIGSVMFTYLLVKKLFQLSSEEEKHGIWERNWLIEVMALSSSLLIAVSPWTVFLSRIAVEANLGSFLVISGVYFFLLGIQQIRVATGKTWAFAVAGLLLGLSLFAYNSFRIFTPLLSIVLLWLYQHDLHIHFLPVFLRRKTDRPVKDLPCHCHLTGIGLFLVFLLGMVMQMTFGAGQARLANISVLDEGAIAQIEQARNTSTLPAVVTKWMHNRPAYLIAHVVKNYVSFFDPGFWFKEGGDHYQFNVQGFGLLYPVAFPLVIIGLLMLWKIPKTARLFLLAWLLLAPIPASPTRDNPHALRIISMSPIPFVLGGLGGAAVVYWLKEILGSARVAVASVVIFLVSLIISTQSYWSFYRNEYRTEFAGAWQYGAEEMVEHVKSVYPEFNKILITKKYGEVHEFLAFYWPFDPAEFQQKKEWDYHADWYWINAYDKFTFINDWEIVETAEKEALSDSQILLVTTYGNAPEGWRLQRFILSLDQTVVYAIYVHPNFTS